MILISFCLSVYIYLFIYVFVCFLYLRCLYNGWFLQLSAEETRAQCFGAVIRSSVGVIWNSFFHFVSHCISKINTNCCLQPALQHININSIWHRKRMIYGIFIHEQTHYEARSRDLRKKVIQPEIKTSWGHTVYFSLSCFPSNKTTWLALGKDKGFFFLLWLWHSCLDKTTGTQTTVGL